MGDSFQHKVSTLLLSQKKRTRYLSVMIIAAIAVTLGVVGITMGHGQAKTHEVRVLDCQEQPAENIAHHHTADCYDAEGNLVCPLEEREAHTHDDSCYETRRTLICGKEESAEHHHTDACYKEEKVLVCGKQETTEEHVHGNECFKTVKVAEGEDAPAAEAAENTTPAQTFKEDLKETNKKGEERVLLTVAADAPDGALPANAKMKVEFVKKDDADKIKTAADDAIKERLGNDAIVNQKSTVNVSFVDASGNAVKPAKDVDFKITNTAIKETDKDSLNLARVDAETGKGEVIVDIEKVNADEKDTTTGNEDTLSFASKAADAFVISQVTTGEEYAEKVAAMPAQSFEGKDGAIRVTVDAPEGAFAEGTTMKVAALDSKDVEKQVQNAVKNGDEIVTVKRAIAADITFYDKDGKEVQPLVPVTVNMTSDDISDIKDPVLVHLPNDAAPEVVKNSSSADDTVSFGSSKFSPYVIAEVSSLKAGFVTSEGDQYKITVSYGSDAQIPSDASLQVKEIPSVASEYADYADAAKKAVNIEDDSLGYTRLFDIAILDGDGNVIEPAKGAKVDVKFELADADANVDYLNVVHFVDDELNKPEVIKDAATSGADEGKTVEFKTASFSTYAVVSVGDYENLDNRDFAFVSGIGVRKNENDKPDDQNWQRDHLTYYRLATNTIANDKIVCEDVFTSGGDILNSNSNKVYQWHFSLVGGNRYYITAEDGRYLNIEDGKIALTNIQQALTVRRGTGKHSLNVMIYNADNNKCLNFYRGFSQDNKNPDLCSWDANNDKDDNNYLKLYELKDIQSQILFSARPTAAKDLQEGHKYVVYQYYYNPEKRTVEYYFIDGNGNLGRAYRKGDMIGGYAVVSPAWELGIDWRDSTAEKIPANFKGTFTLQSVTCQHASTDDTTTVSGTGKYLAPSADGTTVSGNETKLSLDGMLKQTYESVIEQYDRTPTKADYYGFELVHNEDGSVSLGTGRGFNSDDWLFAEVYADSYSSVAHKVDTVDSLKSGVKMTMFDFDTRTDDLNRIIGGGAYRQGDYYNNSGTTERTLVVGVDANTAKFDKDGYPHMSPANDRYADKNDGERLWCFQDLFENRGQGDKKTKYKRENCNHLFLKDTYDALGFYEYSAFENYAELNKDTGDFTVYREIGTPSNNQSYFYKRGNFYPFNSIVKDSDLNLVGRSDNTNEYYGNGEKIEKSDPYDPTNKQPLYLIDDGRNINYNFGMIVKFDFIQPKGGVQKYTDMIYQFNGDDDLYVFIDGVKILDIGGVHDALPGMINFRTGAITYGANATKTGDLGPKPDSHGNRLATTIKQAYEWAGLLPDGSPWDPSKVDDWFDGDTFKDYTKHFFKMFYLEHGEAASNLDVRFNLPAIEPGTFKVSKEITNDIHAQDADDHKPNVDPWYTKRTFAYKLYVTPEGSTNETQINGTNVDTYFDKTELSTAEGQKDPSMPAVSFDAQGRFYLHAYQYANFTLKNQGDKFRVEEVDIDADVTNVQIQPTPTNPYDPTKNYYSSNVLDMSVGEVVFSNEMAPRPLEVRKFLKNPAHVNLNDYFGFHIWTDTYNNPGGVESMLPAAKLRYTVYYYTLDQGQYVWKIDPNNPTRYVSPTGTFYLRANEKAVFDTLIGGTHFAVVEDYYKADYKFDHFDTNANVIKFDNTSAEWTAFKGNEDNNYWKSITNNYYDLEDYHVFGQTKTNVDNNVDQGAAAVDTVNNDEVLVQIYKVNSANAGDHPYPVTSAGDVPPTSSYIGGAHFDIYKGVGLYEHQSENGTYQDNSDGPNEYEQQHDLMPVDLKQYTYPSAPTIPDIIVPETGFAVPSNLITNGVWKFVETKAPSGFQIDTLHNDPIYVRFQGLDSTRPLYFVNGTTGEPLPAGDTTYKGRVVAANIKNARGDYILQIFIYNTPGIELPRSGGPGTLFFTITGAAMIVAAAVTYGISSRRRQEGRL